VIYIVRNVIRKELALPVKSSQSALRVLSVVELVAARQPIGVSGIADLLGEDRSAVQRAVTTLAEAGWIRLVSDQNAKWELAPHILTIAHLPSSSDSLRQRSRPILDALRDETDETAFLAVPDMNRFVVIEVAESQHMLRMAPRIGEMIVARGSATGRAILPFFSPERQAELIDRDSLDGERVHFTATRDRGFSVSVGERSAGVTTLGVPIFDRQSNAVAAVVISGPSERLSVERHAAIGQLMLARAASLSHARP
jgi:IclR family acetate operon transcriptional repressor